jgi:phenylalanyl-tRNA synthetase beta chain
MPTINLIRDHLFEAIGKTYTDEEFDELCFEFGVEVDKVSEEEVEFTGDGTKGTFVVYAIDIPANRYDILCMEGFARALRIFLNLEATPTYHRIDPIEGRQKMIVNKDTAQIRPYVVCAVLKGVQFDKKRYKSFIDLQEKLHQNVCRKRTYVAIGTHDLDTVKGPFRYEARKPEDINFVPLTEPSVNGKTFSGSELLNHYREDPTCKHLKPYTDIIYDSPVYPVIYDSNDQVLSLPPIINSKHSRIQLSTTNVFIECTGTDLTKCNIVLDTVVTMFSEYCEKPFTIDAVDIIYENSDGLENKIDQITPSLSTRTVNTKVNEINGTIGIDITTDEMIKMLNRMQLGPASSFIDDNGVEFVSCTVPPQRTDILHPVDVIEDIAIAYGYNNIVLEVPATLTVGKPLPINAFTDLLRNEVARAGYVEMLTHGLCSKADNFTNLRHNVGPAAELSNPANVEYEVVRTTLLPGALKTLSHNKSISHKDGVKLFEFSDVVIPVDNEIGCENQRRFCAVYASPNSAFEIIHGLVDRLMTCCQIQPEAGYAANSMTTDEYQGQKRVARDGILYSVRPSNDSCFFNGMCAEVVMKYISENEAKQAGVTINSEKVVGTFGVVHPEVLNNFEITYPTTVCEIDVEALMHDGF